MSKRKPSGYRVERYRADGLFLGRVEYGASPIRDKNSRIEQVREWRAEGLRVRVLPFHIGERFQQVYHEEIAE